MTKDEALKLALEALEQLDGIDTETECVTIDVGDVITAIKEALAQPEQDNAYGYASRLATAIWQKHYMKDAPKWKPLDSIEGVLTQIDNMTCGLVEEKPLQPEQEPLTDKQILADETLRYYFGQNGGAGPVSKQGRKVVDAIEAAHGIKGNI